MSNDALQAVVSALEIGIFEQAPDGGFASVGTPPAWMAAFSRNPTFPFLGSFLPQARQFWSEPRADRLTWGPCAEVDADGREFHFTVSALSLPDRKFLVFELDRHAEPMRALLQKAREQALARGRAGEPHRRRHAGRPFRREFRRPSIVDRQSAIVSSTMTPPTVDQLIQRYCECARSRGTTTCGPARPTRPPLERYDEVRALLFRAIVLDAIGMGDAERDREDETWPFLRVVAGAEPSTILVNTPSSDGNQYWEPAEKGTDLSDAEILFVDLFDWDPQAFRDLALVMALVVASPKHPELVGRSILLERSSGHRRVRRARRSLLRRRLRQSQPPGSRRISRSMRGQHALIRCRRHASRHGQRHQALDRDRLRAGDDVERAPAVTMARSRRLPAAAGTVDRSPGGGVRLVDVHRADRQSARDAFGRARRRETTRLRSGRTPSRWPVQSRRRRRRRRRWPRLARTSPRPTAPWPA